MRQISLFAPAERATLFRTEHGGSVRLGRRKGARPVATRRPMHLVLRSSRARGPWSLRGPRTDGRIRETMRALARRYGVRVYEFANAKNHLHLLIRARRRDCF